MSNVDKEEKPTKEEHAVAKFLRFNIPTKEGRLHSMEVKCFVASSAVDALMESKWSASKNAKEPLFVNRNSCEDYCHRLLEKGLFHRAERVLSKKERAKKKKKKKKAVKDTTEKEDGGTGDELRERKARKEDQEPDGDDQEKPVAEEGKVERTEEAKATKKGKKEKPLKLLMTDDQIFLDGEENIYVWIYDPSSPKTLLIGSLIVFGVAALCLLPLWPHCIRVGVYYASMVAATFIGFILSLVVVRLMVFCTVWAVTLGRHHLWVLPNLTEDVSLQESFLPLYIHTIAPARSTKPCTKPRPGKKTKRKSKEKKAKSSDIEESDSEEPEFEMVNRGDVEEDEEEKDDYGDDHDDEDEEMMDEGEVDEEEEDSEEARGEDEEEDGEEAEQDELEEDYEEREHGDEEEDDLELKKDI